MKEPEAKAGEKPKLMEGVVEDVVESEKSGSEREKSGDSEETEVVSEERTEVVGSGDENKGEEADQPVEEEEQDIVVLDDDATEDQRTTRRRKRMARRVTEILATEENRERGCETHEADDEEEDEFPLIRRPRSARLAVTKGAPIQRGKEDDPVQTEGDTYTSKAEEMDTEEKATAERQDKKERKRKGKQLAYPMRKKFRQAARNVVIQEPIQVPYKPTDEENSDEDVERDTEDTARRRRDDPQTYALEEDLCESG